MVMVAPATMGMGYSRLAWTQAAQPSVRAASTVDMTPRTSQLERVATVVAQEKLEQIASRTAPMAPRTGLLSSSPLMCGRDRSPASRKTWRGEMCRGGADAGTEERADNIEGRVR
jgi:hypothetical protein